jgi:hypothetical protein
MKIPGTRQQATQHLAIELDRNLQQPPCGKLGEKMIKGRQRTGRDNHQLILGRSGGDGPHQAVCLGDIWRCAPHRPFAVGVCFSRAEAGKICARHQTPLQMSCCRGPIDPQGWRLGHFVTQMAADRSSPTSWTGRSLADFDRGYGSGLSLSLT